MAKSPTISEQLRTILREDRDSLYAIAEAAKVPRSSLTRFLAGERSLSLETLDGLAAALGLRLVQGRRKKG